MLLANQVAASQANLIPLWRLSLALIPVVVLLLIMHRWNQNIRTSLYAIFRMLSQLFLIGYVLAILFQTSHSWVVIVALLFMTLAASWISLRTIPENRKRFFKSALIAIGVSGGVTLVVITQFVLQPDPWFAPDKLIPLGGMILSSCMNAVSLSAERYHAEIEAGNHLRQARATALSAALIPITNTLFAVGLVSFPGMMTGQVLSGISPLIAARYQIMVMCMTFGSSGTGRRPDTCG